MGICPLETSPFLHQVTMTWRQGGWIGVDLFFVLSGFLVSGLLFREHEKYGQLRIGHFLIRRGLKIYPPFWMLMFVTAIVTLLTAQPMEWRAFACELLFLQNYGPAIWNHTWSLAVEEHFYLLLSAGFFLLMKRRISRPFAVIPWLFICVAILCLALRVHLGWELPYRHKTHLVPTHLRLDSLFFGVLVSYFYHQYPSLFMDLAVRLRWVLMPIGALLLAPAFCVPIETPFISSYGFTLFYIGSGCLLVGAVGCKAPTSRLGHALAYVGTHSYSIYLWHMPVAIWGIPLLERIPRLGSDWFARSAFYLGATFLFGILMAAIVEFPVLRLRDRLFPSRARSMSTNIGELA
jgi:peptidoglycan/LPS O-acetylase OafA/YrhL